MTFVNKARLDLQLKLCFTTCMAKKADSGLTRAIEAAGTGEKLAAILEITPQAISQWEKIPLTRVFDVERLTGVPRHELRPDFFGEKAGPADHEIAS